MINLTVFQTLKNGFIAKVGEGLGTWGPKLLLGLITLFIGLWIVRIVVKWVGKALEVKHVDPTLRPFLITLTAFGLKLVLFIAVAGQIGMQTTSFVAILGAAGLAVGLAFQGGLGNLAGGVLLLVFRPFKVGDVIEAQGEIGEVQEISVFVTSLLTPQNKTVIIPNGALSSGNIVNYSTKGSIRADIEFSIRYDEDHEKAAEVVTEMLKTAEHVLQDPAPSVTVSKLGENGVVLTAMPYTVTDHYWDVHWGLPGKVKNTLVANGFSAAYPTRITVQK